MRASSILAGTFNVEHPAFELYLYDWIQDLTIAVEKSIYVGCGYFHSVGLISHILSSRLSPRSLRSLQWGWKALILADFVPSLIYSSIPSLNQTPRPCPKKRPFFNPYIQTALNIAIKASTFFTSKYLYGPLRSLHPSAPILAAATFFTYDLWRPFIQVQTVDQGLVDIFRRYLLTPSRQALIDQRHTLSFAFMENGVRTISFEYPPLASKTTIRLLKLQTPKDRARRVVSELVAVEINEAPPYDAISYVWGSSSHEHSLVVGDEIKYYIPITKSAHQVLRAVAPLKGTRYIWIDSICINQKDKSEKDIQIPMMNKIYGNAAEVMVSPSSLPTAGTLVSFLNRLYWYYMFKDKTILRTTLKSDEDMEKNHTTKIPFLEERQNWEAWRDFANNNYWTRMWIIQECATAEEITILCEGVPRKWDILVLSTLILRSSVSYTQNEIVRSAFRSTERIFMILADRRGFLEDGPAKPLVDLIVEHSEFNATDPRDMVNALLGISRDAGVSALQPSYRKSLREVYGGMVKFALQTNSFCSFCISGLSHRQRGDTDSGLPSWMPEPLSDNKLWTGRLHGRQYTAGVEMPIDFQVSDQWDLLDLKGVQLDKITSITSDPDVSKLMRYSFEDMDIPDLLGFGIEQKGRVFEMLQLFERHFHTIQQKYNDRKPREAFWQTITDDFQGKGLTSGDELTQTVESLEEYVAGLKEEDPSKEDKYSLRDFTKALSSDLASKQFWPEHSGSAKTATLLMQTIYTHVLAITETGYMAFAPAGTKAGDIIVSFHGSPIPHILRPSGEDNSSYFLWGEAYVHGVMYGEAMSAEETWFTLI